MTEYSRKVQALRYSPNWNSSKHKGEFENVIDSVCFEFEYEYKRNQLKLSYKECQGILNKILDEGFLTECIDKRGRKYLRRIKPDLGFSYTKDLLKRIKSYLHSEFNR